MKTTVSSLRLEDIIGNYEPEIQTIMLTLDTICKKETKTVAKIYGRDMIGYGEITYSNTYVKDQPWFKLGFRVSKTGITLYLNAYNEALYHLAEQLNIKHGKGCYYMKKKDFNNMTSIQQLISISLQS